MKFKSIYPLLRACQDTKVSIILSSPHGIGKSTLFKQFANEHDMFFVHLFAPQFESAGDVIGLPFKEVIEGTDRHIMRFTMPDWLHRMWEAHKQGKKCVLLVDEFNRANEDIRQMGLAWFLDHVINSHEFPPQTLVATAINPDDKGNYSVNFLDPAQMSRFLKIELSPDPESWLEWARENDVHKSVIGFISSNPHQLHHQVEDQDVNSDPRSWEMLSKVLLELESQNGGEKVNEFLVTQASVGKIGRSVGYLFKDFYKSHVTIDSKAISDFVKKSGIKKTFEEKKYLAMEEKAIASKDYTALNKEKEKLFVELKKVSESLSDLYDKKEVQALKLSVLAQEFVERASKKVKDKDGEEKISLKSSHLKDNIELMTFLYSLPPETLASTFKNIKEQNISLLLEIGLLDCNKNLSNTIVERAKREQKQIA